LAAATTYTLTGPTSGEAGEPLEFTVSIGSDTSAGVTITPAASVASSGAFSPATVTLSTASPTAKFTFTPSKLAAANTISTTNSGSLTDPAGIAVAVTAPLTLSGPAAPPPGSPSSYTVEIGEGTITGSITVTPALTPSGWAIAPSTVTLNNSTRKATFAVTPTAPGAAELSVGSNQAFAVPGDPLELEAAANYTSLMTTVKNISGEELHFPFLGARGRTLAAGETYSYPGGPLDGLNVHGFPSDRDRDDFLRALKDNRLEVTAGPPPILTDAVTRATKVLVLSNGSLGTGDPTYGPNVDA